MTREQLFAAALVASLPLTASAEMSQMQIGDAALPYISEGEGQTVVFVHGAISDMRVWEPYRERIAANRRFIAYTQRYFGTTDWPESRENFQRATHVADLIALIEGLDAGPVDLVTWSYSGEIGVQAMLQRPELFRSAVHYEPVLDALAAEAPGGANATRNLFSHFGPAVMAAKGNDPEGAALRFIEAVFNLPADSAGNEAGAPIWRENGHTVLPYISMAPPAPVSCDSLGGLSVPTLVVQGADSYTRFSIMAEMVASCVGNGFVATMPGVNHDGPYRKPQEFAGIIEAFLALNP